jgi:hypothetical protein
MSKFLKNLLKNRKFRFSIDSDKDGKPIVQGELDLSELIDEALRFIK